MAVNVDSKTLIRFMNKVEKGSGEDDCWIWKGACTRPRVAASTVLPYGQFRFEGKTQGAHRVSHKIFKGEIPRGMHVMHQCDNPSCVNPRHLELGWPDENQAEKIARGRHWKKGT